MGCPHGPHFAAGRSSHVKDRRWIRTGCMRRSERLVLTGDSTLERRREYVGAGGEQVCGTTVCRNASVVTARRRILGKFSGFGIWTVAEKCGRGYAGIEDAALFRSVGWGQNWRS